ncbi:MAG: acyl carrier protein [Bacteroidales bacterium]|nr:acyl carrier protein [Bacteroidales bacterium]
MNNETMFSEVRHILAKQLRKDVEMVTMESRIKEELGADSLDILQLLMKIEDDYGIVIPDEKLAGFKTVSDIVEFLDAQKAANA